VVAHDGGHLDARHWPLLSAVFEHAVRNAFDHGIEPPTPDLLSPQIKSSYTKL
jgi:hypothetical protein